MVGVGESGKKLAPDTTTPHPPCHTRDRRGRQEGPKMNPSCEGLILQVSFMKIL